MHQTNLSLRATVLRFRRQQNGYFDLTAINNGIEFPADMDSSTSEPLGFKLITNSASWRRRYVHTDDSGRVKIDGFRSKALS